MSQITAQIPDHIQELFRQKEEIERQIEEWRQREKEKAELTEFATKLKKKRSFEGISYESPPKRLKRVFHNLKVIQEKEKELAKERQSVKEEMLKEIHDYLDEL
jgi:RecA-family ATPase